MEELSKGLTFTTFAKDFIKVAIESLSDYIITIIVATTIAATITKTSFVIVPLVLSIIIAWKQFSSIHKQKKQVIL